MGRRRRKVVKAPIRRLPKIFLCPRCGKRSVRVIIKEESDQAVVGCGSCGLRDEMVMKPAWGPVDAYAFWTDKYYRS